MTKFKRCALSLAVAGAIGLGAGNAQAGALATSIAQISSLTFSNPGGAVLNFLTDFGGAVVYTNSGDVGASLNGASAGSSGVGTPLNLSPACVGACAAPFTTNDAFPMLTNPPAGTFAAADQTESGAPISGLGLPVGATVSSASYASLAGTGDPSATANNGLSGTFVFTLAKATGIEIKFDVLAYLEAFTAAGELFPTNAIASYKACFTIADVATGASVVEYCPDGSLDATKNIGIASEASDPFDLDFQLSRNAPFNGTSLPVGEVLGVKRAGSFDATTVGLLAGNPYQLTARLTTEADALRIPEPDSLALLGASLLGLAGVSRRLIRRKS